MMNMRGFRQKVVCNLGATELAFPLTESPALLLERTITDVLSMSSSHERKTQIRLPRKQKNQAQAQHLRLRTLMSTHRWIHSRQARPTMLRRHHQPQLWLIYEINRYLPGKMGQLISTFLTLSIFRLAHPMRQLPVKPSYLLSWVWEVVLRVI